MPEECKTKSAMSIPRGIVAEDTLVKNMPNKITCDSDEFYRAFSFVDFDDNPAYYVNITDENAYYLAKISGDVYSMLSYLDCNLPIYEQQCPPPECLSLRQEELMVIEEVRKQIEILFGDNSHIFSLNDSVIRKLLLKVLMKKGGSMPPPCEGILL